MMLSTRLVLSPDRIRQVPARFSWIDQRLVREGHLRGLSADARGLYLLLVTVGNVHGLSWYSARRLCLELNTSFDDLTAARMQLMEAGLVAWEDGVFQVLEVPQPRNHEQASKNTVRPTPEGQRAATPEEVLVIIQGAFGHDATRLARRQSFASGTSH